MTSELALLSEERRYGLVAQAVLASSTGISFLRAMLEGQLPAPPICETLGFDLVDVDAGRVVFTGTPQVRHYNPIGTVHGGYVTTLLDSCMGCAVHTLLEAGVGYTTIEFKVAFLRPPMKETGPVRAIGSVLNRGRRVAYAEGRLVDGSDRLLAHATTTCMLFPISADAREPAREAP